MGSQHSLYPPFVRKVLAPLQVRELDLASLASVRRFAAGWEAEGRPLHLLVNNAGVFTIGGGVGCDHTPSTPLGYFEWRHNL